MKGARKLLNILSWYPRPSHYQNNKYQTYSSEQEYKSQKVQRYYFLAVMNMMKTPSHADLIQRNRRENG